MKVLGYITFAILLILLSAYVLTQLWGWFFVPFFGLPELTIAYALGITLTSRLIIPIPNSKKMEDYGADEYLAAVLLPLLLWGLGYLIYLFT